MLLPTLRAFPLDDERDGVREETFGQLESRNIDVFHTERTLAGFAIKMNMTIVMIACTFLFAYLVIQDAASVFESMNHIMLKKKRKHTEDARLVHCYHFSFQHAEALGMRVALQSFHHEYTVGCWLDTFCLQFLDNIFCFHLIIYICICYYFIYLGAKIRNIIRYLRFFIINICFFLLYVLYSLFFEVPLHFRTQNKNL